MEGEEEKVYEEVSTFGIDLALSGTERVAGEKDKEVTGETDKEEVAEVEGGGVSACNDAGLLELGGCSSRVLSASRMALVLSWTAAAVTVPPVASANSSSISLAITEANMRSNFIELS